MKKFTVQCDSEDGRVPFTISVGEPRADRHPIEYQERWLRNEKSWYIPQEVTENFQKLHNIATENKVKFDDLCEYAFASTEPDLNLVHTRDNGILCFEAAKSYKENKKKSTKLDVSFEDQMRARLKKLTKQADSLILFEDIQQQTAIYHEFANYCLASQTSSSPLLKSLLFSWFGCMHADLSKQVTLLESYQFFADKSSLFNLCVLMDCVGLRFPNFSFHTFENFLLLNTRYALFMELLAVLTDACLAMRPHPQLPVQKWLAPLREYLLTSPPSPQ